MSKLMWYVPNQLNNIKHIISCLSRDLKNNYYTFCLCYNRLNLYLPIELKKLILINLFDSQIINPKDILNWWDNYITNPIQNLNNPIYLFEEEKSYVLMDYIFNFPHIDMLYNFQTVKIQNNIGTIQYNNDFLLGILVDKKIDNIEIKICQNSTGPLPVDNLFEFKLDNIYIYYQDIIKEYYNSFLTGDSVDFNPVYFGSVKLWSIRDIMPLFLSYMTTKNIEIIITADQPVDNLVLLCGCLRRQYLHEIINNNLIYNKCIYIGGMLYF